MFIALRFLHFVCCLDNLVLVLVTLGLVVFVAFIACDAGFGLI